jgi:hypothetical protein
VSHHLSFRDKHRHRLALRRWYNGSCRILRSRPLPILGSVELQRRGVVTMRGPHPCCPGRSLVEELTQDESFYYLAISTTGTWLKRSRHLSYAHAFGFKSFAPQRSRNSERLSPNFLFRRTRVVHNMKASEYSMHMIMQLLCIFLAALSRQSKLSAIVSMSSRIFHNLWDLLLASR